MRRIPLACAISLATLVASVQARSAERHAGPVGVRFAGPPATAAQSFLQQWSAQLGLQGAELSPKVTLPVLGSHTVRFGQRYGGVPVFGAAVAVRVGVDGEIKTAVVDIARGLTVSTAPTLDEQSARGLVRQWSGRPVGQEAWTELGVKPDRHGGKLIWRVQVPTNQGTWRYEVDAHSGALLREYSLAKEAMGRVYEVNNLKTPTPVDVELKNLTPQTPQTLIGSQALVGRYVSGNLETQPPQPLVLDPSAVAPDANGDFLFDPVTGWAWDDAFAEVNAYYHMDRMRAFFTDVLKVDMTGTKYRLVVVPHYGPNHQPYPNAMYTPYKHEQDGTIYYHAIFLGGSGGYNYAYDSDVFLHEYTHFINHNAIGFSEGVFNIDEYGLVTMPGSIDEGSADYFSSTVNDDAVVGEASLKLYSRDLDSLPGKCPDSMVGETHQDGELIGTASWAVRKALGAERADPVVWGAMSLLTNSCTLGDFATNVQQELEELKGAGQATDAEIQQVNDAFHARGLDDCGRFLSVDPAKTRTTNMLGLDLLAQYFGAGNCTTLRNYGVQLTSLFQFAYAVKSGDQAVRFKVKLTKLQGGDDWDWDMYVRKGEGVTFQSQGMGMEVDQFDYSLQHIDVQEGELVIDAGSNPPLDPSGTYNLVILQRNCPSARAVVSVATDAPIPDAGPEGAPEVDAGGADGAGPEASLEDAEADGGLPAVTNPEEASAEGGACGCRTHGGAPSGAWLLAFGAMAAAWMRRRAMR